MPVDLRDKLRIREPVKKVRERHAKEIILRLELGYATAEIDRDLLIVLERLLKSAALPFHEAKPLEEIGQSLVAATGGNLPCIRVILHTLRTGHTAWRRDLHAVVEDVDVNLASVFKVVTMNKCVDQDLLHSTLRILPEIHTVVGTLVPGIARMQSNEVFCGLEVEKIVSPDGLDGVR